MALLERLRVWADRDDENGTYALTRAECRELTRELAAEPTEDDYRAARWEDMATAPADGPYRMGWEAALRWRRSR